MPHKPARELRVYANKQSGLIEIVMLRDGDLVDSISYTQEQAEHHARCLIDAIELVNAHGRPKIIIAG